MSSIADEIIWAHERTALQVLLKLHSRKIPSLVSGAFFTHTHRRKTTRGWNVEFDNSVHWFSTVCMWYRKFNNVKFIFGLNIICTLSASLYRCRCSRFAAQKLFHSTIYAVCFKYKKTTADKWVDKRMKEKFKLMYSIFQSDHITLTVGHF